MIRVIGRILHHRQGSLKVHVAEHSAWRTKKEHIMAPDATLAAIIKKSALIAAQRKRRKAGGFKSLNDAIALQRLERDADKLRTQLPALQLV